MLRKLEPGPAIGPLEDRVPIPRSKRFAGLRKVMREMKPGQSFVTGASRGGCYAMARSLGILITVRKETESTIRVWRVELEDAGEE